MATADANGTTHPATGTRPHGLRRWRLWLGVAFAGALIVGNATPALAHSELEASTPRDGARVAEFEGPVSLTFVKPVSPRLATVVVNAPSGDNHARGKPDVHGKTVTQQIEPPDDAGKYTVSYRVVAEDGHSITGELSFRVTGSSASDEESGSVASASEPGHDEGAAPRPGTNAMPERTADNSSSFPLLAVVAAGAPLIIIAGGVAAARSRRARRGA